MSRVFLGIAGLFSICVAQAAFAQEAEKDTPPSREEMRAKLLEQFDKDGDGSLSEDERAALRKEMGERRGRGNRPAAGEGAPGDVARPSREELMKKYDKDGNGQLSDEERAAAREEFMKGRQGRPGQAGQPLDRAALMKEFDKDGDGKLSDEERTALREALAKRMQARPAPGGENTLPSREELRKKFDKDGDGMLDEEEREAARAELQKLRQGAGNPEAPARPRRRPAAEQPE